MAFIKKNLLLKIFEKDEKTGIISTKFSFRCTPSVILGGVLFTQYCIWKYSIFKLRGTYPLVGLDANISTQGVAPVVHLDI